MRIQATRWVVLFTQCLLMLGCGGEEQNNDIDPDPEEVSAFPMEVEVVVEPSNPTLVIEGRSRQSVELVHELLADDSIEYPALADILDIDDEFEPKTRVRFVIKIQVVTGIHDDESMKILADQTYGVLKAEFDVRARQATLDELEAASEAAEFAKKQVAELQQTIDAYLKSWQGLPATDEYRQQRRVYRVMMDSALEKQIEQEEAVKALQRRIDRERFVTLLRVK